MKNLNKLTVVEILFLPLFVVLYYLGYFSNMFFLIILLLSIAISVVDKSNIGATAKTVNFYILCSIILFSFGIFLYKI